MYFDPVDSKSLRRLIKKWHQNFHHVYRGQLIEKVRVDLVLRSDKVQSQDFYADKFPQVYKFLLAIWEWFYGNGSEDNLDDITNNLKSFSRQSKDNINNPDFQSKLSQLLEARAPTQISFVFSLQYDPNQQDHSVPLLNSASLPYAREDIRFEDVRNEDNPDYQEELHRRRQEEEAEEHTQHERYDRHADPNYISERTQEFLDTLESEQGLQDYQIGKGRSIVVRNGKLNKHLRRHLHI